MFECCHAKQQLPDKYHPCEFVARGRPIERCKDSDDLMAHKKEKARLQNQWRLLELFTCVNLDNTSSAKRLCIAKARNSVCPQGPQPSLGRNQTTSNSFANTRAWKSIGLRANWWPLWLLQLWEVKACERSGHIDGKRSSRRQLVLSNYVKIVKNA